MKDNLNINIFFSLFFIALVCVISFILKTTTDNHQRKTQVERTTCEEKGGTIVPVEIGEICLDRKVVIQ